MIRNALATQHAGVINALILRDGVLKTLDVLKVTG